jgi:hypothetical protein
LSFLKKHWIKTQCFFFGGLLRRFVTNPLKDLKNPSNKTEEGFKRISMKKISELMEELGFDPEGSPAVKEAFIKYLIRQSKGVNVLTPTEKHLIKSNPQQVKVLPQPISSGQLSFSFHEDTLPKTRISGKRN